MRIFLATFVALGLIGHTSAFRVIPTAQMMVTAEAPAAQQGEAYPGQSQHKEPPAEWFCKNPAKDVTPAHACTCKNMKATEDDPCCTDPVEDSPKCTTWCYKDHCHCKVICAKSDGTHQH